MNHPMMKMKMASIIILKYIGIQIKMNKFFLKWALIHKNYKKILKITKSWLALVLQSKENILKSKMRDKIDLDNEN